MSSRVEYGQRRIRVTPEAIEAWLVNGNMVKTDLPDDARFLRMFPDEEGRWYYLVFESQEWEEVEEGMEVPEHELTVQESPLTFKIQ